MHRAPAGHRPYGGWVVVVGCAVLAGVLGLLLIQVLRPGIRWIAGPAAASATPLPRGAVTPGDLSSAADAVRYLRERTDAATARRVKEARWSGSYLRVYTDFSESAINSRGALSLCGLARKYLTERLGVKRPILFVHAAEDPRDDNGHPVIANIVRAGDSCSVG